MLVWEQCPSTTTGGKPHFYISKVVEYGPENWGFHRVVWDRAVRAYAATTDQKHGDRPTLHGYYGTVAEAKAACEPVNG